MEVVLVVLAVDGSMINVIKWFHKNRKQELQVKRVYCILYTRDSVKKVYKN